MGKKMGSDLGTKPKAKAGRKPGTRNRGWSVGPWKGQWRARVLVPETGRYEERAGVVRSELADWAERRRGELISGHATSQAGLKQARTADLADLYLADLGLRERTPKHIAWVKRVLQSAQGAVPVLAGSYVTGQLEAWLRGLQRAGLSPRTRNMHLVNLRALCRWAIRRGYLVEDPTRVLQMAQEPTFIKAQWTVPELRTILQRTRFATSRAEPYLPAGAEPRGRAEPYHLVVALMTYAGLRLDEALHLRWEDVDWSGGCLLVRIASGASIKGKKERIVPLQAELREILTRNRPADGGKGSIAQVMGTKGHRDILGFVRRAGIDPGDRSPHSFRHTYAGLMTASGVPSLLLAAYMGHSSVKTTAIYAQLAARYVGSTVGWGRGEFKIF